LGVRIEVVPLTREKIHKALTPKAAGRAARFGPSRFPDVPWPKPLDVEPPPAGAAAHAHAETS
jgi:hypothetical protein